MICSVFFYIYILQHNSNICFSPAGHQCVFNVICMYIHTFPCSNCSHFIIYLVLKYYLLLFSPFMPNGPFYRNSLDRSISYIRGVWFLLLLCFVEMSELNANSVDPDQMLQNAASDLGLYCLQMSLA